jgi:hypothetical protein
MPHQWIWKLIGAAEINHGVFPYRIFWNQIMPVISQKKDACVSPQASGSLLGAC